MGLTLEAVVFYFLAVFVIAMSVLAVITRRIVRSATHPLFVLFGIAGIYFPLEYTFLGSAQIMVCAGDTVVLYVFPILLTSGEGDRAAHLERSRFLTGLAMTIVGATLMLFITLTHKFVPTSNSEPIEISIKTIGHVLLSSGKYGYVSPFETVGILLLACIAGGLLITRKRQRDMMIHMECYLVVSTIMMFVRIYGFFIRRDTLTILISVELMPNAIDTNFAVFNRFLFPGELEGYFFALFSIAISAVGTAIAIAVMTNIYRNTRSIQVKDLGELKQQTEHTSCSINMI